jgi:hypothetical protein
MREIEMMLYHQPWKPMKVDWLETCGSGGTMPLTVLPTNFTKGAFTLARFRGWFCTKFARLVMKKYFFSKMYKLNAKSRANFANVNAP